MAQRGGASLFRTRAGCGRRGESSRRNQEIPLSPADPRGEKGHELRRRHLQVHAVRRVRRLAGSRGWRNGPRVEAVGRLSALERLRRDARRRWQDMERRPEAEGLRGEGRLRSAAGGLRAGVVARGLLGEAWWIQDRKTGGAQ